MKSPTDPIGLMQSAYLSRYENKPAAIGNIRIIKTLAENSGGQMYCGFSQGHEDSISTRIASNYLYSNNGQCFSYTIMWLRYHFEGRQDDTFAAWLYGGIPAADVSDAGLFAPLDARNAKLNIWMKRQFYPPVRGTAYERIEDFRGKVADPSDPRVEETLAGSGNPIEPDVPLDSVTKYTIPPVKKSLTGKYYIDSPYSRILARVFSSYKYIEDIPDQPLGQQVATILKAQLEQRKITKAFRKGGTTKNVTGHTLYSFALKPSAYDGKGVLLQKACTEIGCYLQEVLSKHNKKPTTRELFITFSFKTKSGGGHVTGIYSQKSQGATLPGHIDMFDSNYGIFTFPGDPKESDTLIADFVHRLMWQSYDKTQKVDIAVFEA